MTDGEHWRPQPGEWLSPVTASLYGFDPSEMYWRCVHYPNNFSYIEVRIPNDWEPVLTCYEREIPRTVNDAEVYAWADRMKQRIADMRIR